MDAIGDRRTPQLQGGFDSIILAQRPKSGTHIDNWMEHRTGLIDIEATLDGKRPTTVMRVSKAVREDYNEHLTVKPVRLIAHLIRLFSTEGQTVLDPFLGSGTTAVAASYEDRECIGIEIDPRHVEIAERRIAEMQPTLL